MPAVIQVHTHEGVTGLQHRKKHCHIRLCAGMRLYIDILTAKKFFCTVSGNLLNHVHALAAAVISLAGIPFCILIRKRASHRRHNRLTHPVFRSNQLNMGVLSVLLVNNRLRDLRVNISYLIQ